MSNTLLEFSSNFSQDFYRALDVSMILSLTDLDWNIKYVSSEFCNISWYSKEELLWKNHRIIRHPDVIWKIFEHMRATIKSWKTRRWIIKNRKKNWNYYWVKTIVIPLKNNEWEVIEYISIRSDITKLIDSISELNDYKKAIDFSGYFIKLDENWFIKFMNKKFIKALWFKESEILWKPLLEEILYESISSIARWNLDKLYHEVIGVISYWEDNINVNEILNLHKPWKWIIKNKTNYNTFIWLDTTIFPIFDLDNKIKEYIIIWNDITDLEIAKQRLKISFHKLKELDDKKSEFLNIASHELRTPMTAIRGYLSMMLDWDFWELNENLKKYLSKMFNNSQKLLDLINDMLDLAKLESSRLDFSIDNFDIINLIDDIILEINPLIKGKSHNIEFIHEESELFVESDKDKIKHIIINLLSNAIKFTAEKWTIKIICNSLEDFFQIDIIDDGMWISKENQKIIFEKFGQVKNSLTREISWTGLWLPIVKSTIDRLWWKLELESTEWKWSKFTFKIANKFI